MNSLNKIILLLIIDFAYNLEVDNQVKEVGIRLLGLDDFDFIYNKK